MPLPLLLSLRATLPMVLARLLVLLRCWRQLRELQFVFMDSVDVMEMRDGTGVIMLSGGTMVMEREWTVAR